MTLQMPPDVEKYGETAVFSEQTVPEKLLNNHNTKAGVWGRIVVLEGALDYIINGSPERTQRLTPGVFGAIAPQELHRVAPVGAVRFKVEFYRAP